MFVPDKLFIAKIEKGSNSVNTGDSVTILAFRISFIIMFQCINLQYVLRYASEKRMADGRKKQ